MKKHSWKNDEKADFLIRVGRLLDQGYTIPDSLELFLKYEKEKLKPMLRQILEELKRGSSFSETLVKLEIPKSIISFVYFSEHYGNLARGLVDGGDLLRKTEENKIKLQKTVRYPLFLFWVLIVFFVVMYQYLFPQFTLLFSTINIPLPLMTRLFLSILEWFPLFSSLVLVLIISFLIYYYAVFKRKPILQKAVTISRIPIIGYYYQMVITYFFAQNLSCLVKNGMAIYDALILFKDHKGLGYISKISGEIITNLEKGETLQQALLNETVYLSGLAYIVEHGHSRGKLDEELEYFSKWVLMDFEERIKKQIMIIQPILFLFIGLVVLAMFASILIPIFTLINGL